MTNDQLLVLVAFMGIAIPASVTLGIGWLTYRNNDAKQRLDETNIKFDSLKEMVTISHDEIDRLRIEVNDLRKENRELREELDEVKAENLQLKTWAESLVGVMESNGLGSLIPAMPDREKTRPRKAA